MRPTFTIGIEEEYQTVDPVTRDLRSHIHAEMIEKGKPCTQIAQQLQAVEGAIENAKKALIHDHISHSLQKSYAATAKGRAALREFRLIAKYL